MERLNIATIGGLSIAMAVFLWSNGLLPAGIAQRTDWEINAFFIAWSLSLVHAFARARRRARLEQLSSPRL